MFRYQPEVGSSAQRAGASKTVIALQRRQAMQDRNLTLSAMAAGRAASQAQLNRVLGPDAANVTLETLRRAANARRKGGCVPHSV